jgi:Domain of unknown function (DUF4868)
MARNPDDWAELELGDGIRLLLGWRDDDGSLDARPVKLSAEAGTKFKESCEWALNRMRDREMRPYDGEATLDEGQYFTVAVAVDEDDGDEEEAADVQPLFPEELVATAEIVTLVRGAFERDDDLSRDELSGTWLFFLVVAELKDGGEPIGFVRQINPHRGFSPGRFPTIYADRLQPLDKPVLNFDFEFDVVIAPDELAVLKTTGFERVFSDLEVAITKVPEHTSSVVGALSIDLSPQSVEFLEETCSERPRNAKRLRNIANAPHLPSITRARFRNALARHGLPRDRFGAGTQVELHEAADVGAFLDMLEQRYYETDFTDEHRRADRSSARP